MHVSCAIRAVLRGVLLLVASLWAAPLASARAVGDSPDEVLLVVLVAPGDDGATLARREAGAREALSGADWRSILAARLPERWALAGWPSPAEAPSVSGRRAVLAALGRASDHYFAMRLDAAAVDYADAFRKLFPRFELLTEEPDARAAVFDHGLRYARLLRQRGDAAAADTVLQHLAARTEASRRPSPDEHPPELLDAYAAASDRATRTTATLTVTLPTSADGEAPCRVYADGRLLAQGERAEVRLPQGRHRVQARCGPRWSAVRTVDIPGADARLVLDPEVDGAVRVEAGATLRLALSDRSQARLARAAAAIGTAASASRVAFALVDGDPPVRVFAVDGAVATPVALHEEPVFVPPPRAPRPRIWTWVTLGAGLGLMGAGGYFHWATQDETRRINAGAERLAERDQNLTGMGVCYGLGAAALVSSVVLFFLEPGIGGPDAAKPPATSLHLRPTAGGLLLQGRF